MDEVIELWEVAQLSSNRSQIQVQDHLCHALCSKRSVTLIRSETGHSACFLATSR